MTSLPSCLLHVKLQNTATTNNFPAYTIKLGLSVPSAYFIDPTGIDVLSLTKWATTHDLLNPWAVPYTPGRHHLFEHAPIEKAKEIDYRKSTPARRCVQAWAMRKYVWLKGPASCRPNNLPLPKVLCMPFLKPLEQRPEATTDALLRPSHLFKDRGFD